MQANKIPTYKPDVSTVATFTHSTLSLRQKRNKFLSFFPNITKNNNAPENHHLNTKKVLYGSTSQDTARVSTLTNISLSSSSTISSLSTIPESRFRVKNPSSIPEYKHLRKYLSRFQNKLKQRTEILKLQLLPWFRKHTLQVCLCRENALFKEDAPQNTGFFWGLKSPAKEKKELEFGRLVLLKWWRVLLNHVFLTNNEDRHLYFECVLQIIQRQEFSDFDFLGPFNMNHWCKNSNMTKDLNSLNNYRQLLKTTLRYALDRLNQKAIYSNMISFCAKVLAICYFKVPGLAYSLLKVLSIQPSILKSLNKEMKGLSQSYQDYREMLIPAFPTYLHPLMASDLSSHESLFRLLDDSHHPLPIKLSGNWMRRWQSDDSELFFSFYRHYHSTIQSYISTVYTNVDQHQRNGILTISPGYMYLASFFAGKIESLLHCEVISVTNGTEYRSTNRTTSSFLPFDNVQMVDETSNHKTSTFGKPKLLDIATMRFAECMVWCAIASDPNGLYHDMLNVWIRTAIKKTVLTEVEQVYCLLDFVDQAIIELQKFPITQNIFLMDLPFILHMLDIILSRSDHTTSLLRAISFIYVHFEFLTSHTILLDLLCNQVLLDQQIFERLFLHWGKNVRIFFLRCLVWRVGRVWQPANVQWTSNEVEPPKQEVLSACDGRFCVLEWYNTPLTFVSNDTETFRQCSLEIHIVLEALMTSFYRQHDNIQNLLNTLQPHERIHFLSSKHASDSQSPLPDTKMVKISPQLSVHLHSSMPTSSRDQKNKTPIVIAENKQTNKVNRSRISKDKLTRIFSSNTNVSTEKCHQNKCSNSISTCVDEGKSGFAHLYAAPVPPPPPRRHSRDQCKSNMAVPPAIVARAHRWQYPPSSHVYAVKVVNDINMILQEYVVWLDSKSSKSSIETCVPRLSLEWPRNWSFSNL